MQPDAGRDPAGAWVNVVAHPTFGFAATDIGTGFTWSENSHDNRLTPWRNDPVSDPPGEAMFIRDDDSGRFWSATPLPAGGGQPYTVRHGQGYTHLRARPRRHRLAAARCSSPRAEHREGVPARPAEHVEPDAAASRSRSTWSGSSAIAASAPASTSSPAASRRPARCSPRTPSASVRGSHRVPRSLRRRAPDAHGGSHRVHRPQRLARRRRPRSSREDSRIAPAPRSIPAARSKSRSRSSRAQEHTVVGLLGEAADAAQRVVDRPRSRAPQGVDDAFTDVARFWDGLLGTIAGHDARPVDGPAAQPLAALSGAGLPHLGPLGVLPVERRLRLPRPAAGRAGADPFAAAPRPRAHPARRLAAVRRRRRPALVARAGRPRRPHALLRRPAVARLLRRCTTSTRPATTRVLDESRCRSSKDALLEADEHEAYERPSGLDGARLALRALRPRDRAQPRHRRARAAADGHRRLERRHEPRRRRGQGRERLARLVPRLAAAARSPTRRGARRRGSRRRLPRATPIS